MYCVDCGAELTGSAKFCRKCGAKTDAAASAPSVKAEPQTPPQAQASPATPEAPPATAFPSAGADAEPSVPSADTQPVLPVAETRRHVMPLVLGIVALVCLGAWWLVASRPSQTETDAQTPTGSEETAEIAALRVDANAGDADSQYSLAVMYANGLGVPQDAAEAVRWFRLAAEQGHASAQSSLGFAYANGFGVLEDDAEAVRWYRLAAEQGHARAQYNLGIKYGNGEGVPQDDAEAVR